MECRFTFRLESHNNETNKNVNHEECNDDKVDKIEKENIWTVVLLWTNVSLVGVNGDVQNSGKKIIRFNIFVIYQFKLLDLLESNNNQP